MKILLLSLVLGVSSCASVPVDPWQGLDPDTTPATTSIDCGGFPLPSEASEGHIAYDKAGTNALEAYRACSEANQAIVDAHAQQIGQLEFAVQGLVDAGQAQYRIAEMRQTMIEDERKHNFWTSIGYWFVIVGMGLAL